MEYKVQYVLAIGLESDDVTLVLKLGLSIRQDSCTVQIVRLPGPDTIKSKLNKIFSFRVCIFVFLWVLNSWTDISMATPDPGPESITETHLDRMSLVSHPGVHYSRTSIIRPPLGSGPWIGVRIREMFRIRKMSTCAHYMYLIAKVIENHDLSCPSRTSTHIHIHHTGNTNITSMMF